MYYVLINTITGNYFKREIANNEEGKCIDVDNIQAATKFDDYSIAISKCRFIGGMKYKYEVVEVR